MMFAEGETACRLQGHNWEFGTREADASLVEINSILFDLMNNWNFEGKWYHYLQVDISQTGIDLQKAESAKMKCDSCPKLDYLLV